MTIYQSALLLCSWVFGGCAPPQTPLGFGSHASYPLSEAFEQKVDWSLKHFNIPGLAVSIINGDRVYTKVRWSSHRPLFHIIGLTDGYVKALATDGILGLWRF